MGKSIFIVGSLTFLQNCRAIYYHFCWVEQIPIFFFGRFIDNAGGERKDYGTDKDILRRKYAKSKYQYPDLNCLNSFSSFIVETWPSFYID
jgi:hypothetical protein